ncbi:MAG: YHS domain protein [Desulfobacteraceae bacterium]|nr:MAG: YHS domain protein [Desulfobacteraceae bacterium]
MSVAGNTDFSVNKDEDSIAIKGYDPVAYFTQGRAIKGDPTNTFDWQGARWQFSTIEHRDMFASNPELYAPQYGGFCSMAMATGQFYGVDPEAFKIIAGKLYLNYNHSAMVKFEKKAPENIQKADSNWIKKAASGN